jgi:hypothetical protein
LFPRLLRVQSPHPRTRLGLLLLRPNPLPPVRLPLARHRQDIQLSPARNPR